LCTLFANKQSAKDSIIHLLDTNIDDTTRIDLLCVLSHTSLTSDFEQRLFYLHSSLTTAEKISSSSRIAYINKLIGNLYMERFDSVNGFSYLNRAYDFYIKSGTGDEKAGILLDLGYSYSLLDDNYKACRYYNRALEDVERDGLKAHIYNLLGTAYFSVGEYDKSISNLLAGTELIDEEKDAFVSSQININLGTIYFRMKDYEKSLSYFVKGSEQKMRLGDKVGLIRAYNNIGSVLYSQGKTDETESVYKKALALAREINNESLISLILNNLGEITGHRGNHKQAIEYFEEAMKLKYAASNPNLYSNMADEYMLLGNNNRAINYYLKGYGIAQSSNKLESVKTISKKISDFYRANSDFGNALKYIDIHIASKDSLLNEFVMKRVLDMQNKYESEKLQTEIELLRKENELKEVELSGFNRLVIISVVAFILFSLVILLLAQRYRYMRKQSSDRLLRQKDLYDKEREILEKELLSKNHELTSHIMHVTEKNEFIYRVTQDLLNLSKYLKVSNQKRVRELVDDLKKNTKEDIWTEFDIRFKEVQKDFYDNLNTKYPDLSIAEIRLSAFLRMNMTTKEISAITHMSPGGIDTARSRLRKKLGIIDSNINLNTFIKNI
jgi:tetratricopeptide (TPR) repeat protein